MGIKLKTASVDLRTTTGTQDITLSGIGDASGFKGALFFMTVATSTDTVTNNAYVSYGGTDGTDQFCVNNAEIDNFASTQTFTASYNNRLIGLIDSTGADISIATFNSWITDGIRINVTVTTPGAYKGYCIFFWDDGSDLQAKVINTDMGNSNLKTVTGVGFEPELVLAFSPIINPPDNAGFAASRDSIGFVYNTKNPDPQPQRSLGLGHPDNLSTTRVGVHVSTSSSVQFLASSTGILDEIAIQKFTSDGYDMASTGALELIVKTFNVTFNGAKKIWLDHGTGPVVTDTDFNVPVGFKPEFVFVAQAANILLNTTEGGVNSDRSSRTFYCFDSEINKNSIGYTTETNVGTTNTCCWSNITNNLQLVSDDKVGDYILASTPVILNDGFSFPASTITTADSTPRYYLGFAIGEESRLNEIYPSIGGTGRVMPYNTEFPWWENFEEPQPKEPPPGPLRDPTLSEQLAEIAGELDVDAEDLRVPQEIKTNVTLGGLISGTVESSIEYYQDIQLNSDLGFKVNTTHERWSDSVWVMRESIAAQNKQLMAILMTKLLD